MLGTTISERQGSRIDSQIRDSHRTYSIASQSKSDIITDPSGKTCVIFCSIRWLSTLISIDLVDSL
jgi:hypothetical protein